MVSLYFFSSMIIDLTLKSTPIVAFTWSGGNQTSSVNLKRKEDFPVPESPMSKTLNVAEVSEREFLRPSTDSMALFLNSFWT
jgi:hypothetical protein